MVNDLPFPCSTAYYNFLTYLKNEISNSDTQKIIIFFGKVGSGKSCRAQEPLYFVNGDNCSIDQICFDKNELIDAVSKYKKSCVIIDEGTSIVFSREAMSREGRLIAALMAQIRAQNLLICICIPRLKDIEGSVLEAADAAIMVYETREKGASGKIITTKGNMRLWANTPGDKRYSKLVHYIMLKKRNPWAWAPQPIPNITQKGQQFIEGKQTGFYAVPEAEYRLKKFDILKKYQRVKDPIKKTIDYSEVDKLLDKGLSCFDIAQKLGISEVSARTRKRQRKK